MGRPPFRPPPYAPAQRRQLEEAVRRGDTPRCPVCDVELDHRSVPPRSDVSYVRDRLWLTCPACGRSAVLDR